MLTSLGSHPEGGWFGGGHGVGVVLHMGRGGWSSGHRSEEESNPGASGGDTWVAPAGSFTTTKPATPGALDTDGLAEDTDWPVGEEGRMPAGPSAQGCLKSSQQWGIWRGLDGAPLQRFICVLGPVNMTLSGRVLVDVVK